MNLRCFWQCSSMHYATELQPYFLNTQQAHFALCMPSHHHNAMNAFLYISIQSQHYCM